jgi:hypothetical protein
MQINWIVIEDEPLTLRKLIGFLKQATKYTSRINLHATID